MQLSSSALSLYNDCHRCFYLDRKLKIARPRGIFSSLPTGIDKILKEKLDTFRGSLPPQLQVKELEGFELYTGVELSKMRNWKTNPLKMKDPAGNTIVGAFDDLLYNPEKDLYAILDVKTKGSRPDQAYCEKYYQKQVDIYSRFLEIGGKTLAPFAVLLYFWCEPGENELVTFKSEPFFLTPFPGDAELLFKDAISLLEGPLPRPGIDCEWCAYHERLSEYND